MPPKAAKKRPAKTAPAEDSSAGAEASAPSPSKKGRGRPKGSGTKIPKDSSAGAVASAPSPSKKGRGRPKGSGTKIPKMTVYHYTNKAGYEGIKQSGYIEQSTKLDKGDDALFGTGVYLTTVAPSKGKKQIVIACWGSFAYPSFVNNGRVDYVFEIQIPPNKVKKGTMKREVYLYKGSLMLDDFTWKAYPVPN